MLVDSVFFTVSGVLIYVIVVTASMAPIITIPGMDTMLHVYTGRVKKLEAKTDK